MGSKPKRPKILPSTLLKRGWCQGSFAKDVHGRACNEFDDDASSFCLLGASYKARTPYGWRDAVRKVIRTINISRWNDSPRRKKSEVIAVAIEAERRLGWRPKRGK